MLSPDVSPLGLYRYDAVDRLATCQPADQASIRRFYQLNRLATAVQGNTRHSVIQADDLLLAAQRVGPDQSLTGLLATDQANSVLHSVEAMWSQTFAYSPYGVRSPQTAAVGIPGFTGQTIDPVTGHYLLGNGVRAFNPTLMRFNSPDALSPFGEGGLNAYAYCEGDPVNYSDPSGSAGVGVLAGIFLSSKKHRKSIVAGGPSLYFKKWALTIDHALRPNSKSPQPLEGARKYINDVVSELDKSLPFINRLEGVNRNLGSHGDRNLSFPHARYYADLASQVDSGHISNSGAHVAAAMKWADKMVKERDYTGSSVGLAFNFAAAFLSGPTDHAMLRSGKFLRMSSTNVRQTGNIRSTTRTP